jgi:uncharacterized repeat protein (TIGR01451 family)
MAVAPDDAVVTGFITAGPSILRAFSVTNTGNRDDRFRVTSAGITGGAVLTALHFDLDGDGILGSGDPPVTVGVTASPVLAPGTALAVLATYSAVAVPTGTALILTLEAESLEPGAVNGLATDTGTIRDQVGGSAVFSDPADPSLPPSKTGNGLASLSAARGEEVRFRIAFRNSGVAAAANVVVTDPLDPNLTYVPGSLELDGLALTDAIDADGGEAAAGVVTVRLPVVAPGEAHSVEFRARISTGIPGGTLLRNAATVEADSVPPVVSGTVRLLADPAGVVFDAATGAALGGSGTSLLADPGAGTLLAIPATAGAGADPNLDNVNPFPSDTAGRYGYLLDPAQLGSPGAALRFFLRVDRAGYLPRLIQLDAVAEPASTPSDPVFTLTVTPADSLPIAAPGGFSLVPGPVVLTGISAVGIDVPLFASSALSVVKTADRATARVGETVGYRVQVLNSGALPVTGITLSDLLPEFLDPVEGASRRIDAAGTTRIDPARAGRSLAFALGDLAPGEQVEISYRARIAPGAPAAALSNRALAAGTLSTGDPISGGPARAVVFVRQGLFSFQQTLIGRVFEDADGDGKLSAPDRPLPGIRVVLDNGMTVATDSQGLYSFPSVPEGARAIGLDESSFPEGICAPASERLDGRGRFRLLRTPLHGGALLRQDFHLASRSDCPKRGIPSRISTFPPGADGVPGEATGEAAAAGSAPTAASGLPPAPTAESGPTGTATTTSMQTLALPALAPGTLSVLEPADGSVAMDGALRLVARTHRSGGVRVSVNDHRVSADRIGRTDLDDRNLLATFTFVGIPVLPGRNVVSVEAIREEGGAGERIDLVVFGRGPVSRLRLAAAATDVPADGRSGTEIRIDLLDAWGNPAQDDRVRIRTSAGRLRLPGSDESGTDLAVRTRDGSAAAVLLSDPASGVAHLSADLGDLSETVEIRFSPADAPPLLVGLAEGTWGFAQADSGVGTDAAAIPDGGHGRIAFFYKGAGPGGSLLTTAYDSDRRLNRSTDENRLFELDPLERVYPVMGDSSVRFDEALSNSRGYVRLEKDRARLLYGDFEPRMGETRLARLDRKLTGLELSLDGAGGGGLLTLGVARPDTAFAREAIPASGIGGLYRLSHAPLVPGSEVVTLEIHDRRNPEEVLSREPLARGVDYDLDPLAGTILFKRPLDAFTGEFHLAQIVVLYEYRADGFEAVSWFGRGRRDLGSGGTRAGFSVLGEMQDGAEDFRIAAADLLQKLPGSGTLSVEAARSDGRPLNRGNASLGTDPGSAGTAFRVEYVQTLPALRGPLRASFSEVDRDFVNPYGASITPGSRRSALGWEPSLNGRFRLAVSVQDETNRTDAVDNGRTTASLKLGGRIDDRTGFTAGVEHRDFTDLLGDREVRSDLITAGMDIRPTPRVRFSFRREQNLRSGSDPSFPDSTFLTAALRQSDDVTWFLRFRDSSRPIEAIADVAASGLIPPRSRSEIQIGAESKLGNQATLSSRYQIQNGIEGTDSYAVIGLGTRLPVRETLAADFRGEAGLHVEGPGNAFTSFSTGLTWIPEEALRASIRYELRDADGTGQTLSAAAVGKPSDDLTLLLRLAASDASQAGRDTTSVSVLGGLAIRPLERDDFGLLFAWNRRDRRQGGSGPGDEVRTLTDTLSTDAVLDLTEKLRGFGRVALSLASDRPQGLPEVSSTTTLAQIRLEYRVGRRFDLAGEARDARIWQEALRRDSFALEWGAWITEDLRIAVGYGFTGSRALEGEDLATRSGPYLNLTTKINRILDLFGRRP